MSLIDSPTDLLREKFLEAYDLAVYSPDPSTQTGAVIYKDGFKIGAGFNGFTRGVVRSPDRLERPLKYHVIEHAERAAIYDAVRSGNGSLLDGSTMIALWAACPDCARAIIEVGITRVYTHKFYQSNEDDDTDRISWNEPIQISMQMFEEAGVEIVFCDFELGFNMPLLFNGEKVKF